MVAHFKKEKTKEKQLNLNSATWLMTNKEELRKYKASIWSPDTLILPFFGLIFYIYTSKFWKIGLETPWQISTELWAKEEGATPQSHIHNILFFALNI